MSIGKSFHLPAIQLRDFVPIKKIGMMEDGNNGFWGVNGMGYWKNRLLFELTPGVANDIFHFIFKWDG